jgi:ABC-type cobalamin/Fe3+-siderophores transport system ATPase subunit
MPNNVSFEVPDGVFASIIGKSGSGKSTLLALLGALMLDELPIVVGDSPISLHDAAHNTAARASDLCSELQPHSQPHRHRKRYAAYGVAGMSKRPPETCDLAQVAR